MGRNHVRVYTELSGVELVAVADTNFATAQDISSTYGAKPFKNYQEMLELGLDAVSVAVPTTLHAEVTIAAANYKTHVLVEKPIAHTVDAAREIIASCADNQVKLMVGHIERFNPIIPVIKKAIAGKRPNLLEITRIGPFPPRIKDVGVIKDLAIHDVDLFRYITGSEVRKIYGLASGRKGEYEDTAVLIIEMANGTIGRITVNWLTPFKVRDLMIATRECLIKYSFIDQKVTEFRRSGESEAYLVNELKVPWCEPLKAELKSFIDCIRSNSTPLTTGEDGLRALEALESTTIFYTGNS